MRFQIHFFIASTTLLLIEIAIALWVKDDFIRPYLGDTLATIFVYTGIRTFFRIDHLGSLILGLGISLLIELSQYYQLVTLLQWERNTLARTLLGTSASWGDVWAYTTGAFLVSLLPLLQKKSINT